MSGYVLSGGFGIVVLFGCRSLHTRTLRTKKLETLLTDIAAHHLFQVRLVFCSIVCARENGTQEK